MRKQLPASDLELEPRAMPMLHERAVLSLLAEVAVAGACVFAAGPAWRAVDANVAPGYQDAHAAYSDPADAQQFVTNEINALERVPDWRSTAVIIAYDDSDGWYDHQYPGIQNPSLSPADNLTNTSFDVGKSGTSGQCGPNPQTRCGWAASRGAVASGRGSRCS
jgi:hypothetical protein